MYCLYLVATCLVKNVFIMEEMGVQEKLIENNCQFLPSIFLSHYFYTL